MLLVVRISSYGCTWDVWRALKKLELPSLSPSPSPIIIIIIIIIIISRLKNSRLKGVSNWLGLGQCAGCHPLRRNGWGQSISGLGERKTSAVSLQRIFSRGRAHSTFKCWLVQPSVCARCGQGTQTVAR